jgi:hypothetical protein
LDIANIAELWFKVLFICLFFSIDFDIFFHFVVCQLAYDRGISCHVTTYDIAHNVSRRVVSCCIAPFQILACHTMSYHTIPYDNTSLYVVSYHIRSDHIRSYRIISYHVLPYHAMPYHTMPCNAISIYIYIYIYISILYIRIYTERERELCIYIYIYMYHVNMLPPWTRSPKREGQQPHAAGRMRLCGLQTPNYRCLRNNTHSTGATHPTPPVPPDVKVYEHAHLECNRSVK